VKQINCKTFKKFIVDALYNYDQLPEKDKRSFHEHLTTCPSCAIEYEELAAVLGLMDRRQVPEMDEEYWDSYYLRLQAKMSNLKKKNNRWVRLKKWRDNISFDIQRFRLVLYPAATLLLVLLGIVIGKYLYQPPVSEQEKDLIAASFSSGSNINPAVVEHFESLRPLLIDCVNYSGPEAGSVESCVLVNKQRLEKLKLQNLLLKRIAARGNDVVLTQLLEELELILLEISNAEPDESKGETKNETLDQVRDMLKKNDTLFKMKVYKPGSNRNPHLKI
jgi:hypothetical protein